MSQRDNSNLLRDGFTTLERGMNSGRDPSLLAANQMAFGINTTVRGGFVGPRPGWSKLELDFGNTTASRFTQSRWQGAKYYKPLSGEPERIVCVIGGRQFVFTPDQPNGLSNTVQEITPALNGVENADVNNSYRWRCWMEQAEDFLIIQDGQSGAIIYNGSEARRANDGEIPTGTVMAYGLGRLWVARGREFIASDIVGGPSGTDLYSKRDAVLHFTENDYLSEGGTWVAPGEITAMAFPTTLNTSVGQRDLLVFHDGGAVAVTLPTDRDAWKNLQEPAQRVVLEPFGATSQNSMVKANEDIWFRGGDGVRSFVVAQRDFGVPGNIPMSREMNAVLESEDETLLSSVSGVLFDNRLLMTCVGQRDYDRGNYFLGILALDFDVVSSMSDRLPPVYDGLWTGLKVFQLVSGKFRGKTRCFAFVLNSDRELEVWELTKNDIADRPTNQVETLVEWKVYPKAFNFGDPEGLKQLVSARLWASDIRGDVRFCVEYRPDQYPIWQAWGDCWTKKAKKTWCAGDSCVPRMPLPQFRTKMRLPQLVSTDPEHTDDKPFFHGFEFQPRITVLGHAKLRKLRLKAQVVQEAPDGGCPETDVTTKEVTGCTDYYFGYNAAISNTHLLTTDDDGAVLTTETGEQILV